MIKNKTGILVLLFIILLTGCSKKDNYDNITIYTTEYPIEYVTSELYKNHAKIYSIYPDDIEIQSHELTEKQIDDYSKSDIFIYTNNESKYAIEMIKKNKNLRLIDSTSNIDYDYKQEEMWLDPSNMLKIALNIKQGFNQYIENPYLIKEINENYEKLKVNISEIDAELKIMADSKDKNTIVVSSNAFLFLKKYGFNVIVLEENEMLSDKVISDVKKGITNNDIKYIFGIKGVELNNTIKNIVSSTNIEVLYLNNLTNISSIDRKNKMNYITIMKNNLDLLKQEVY